MVAGNEPDWGPATVVSADDVADGVRLVVLAPERPRPARPGTHVDVRLQTEVGGVARTLTRSYSVVRSEHSGRRLTLSVQLAHDSRGGSRSMHRLRPGDQLTVTQPLQNFELGVGADRYVLLAGGIGLTALMAMAETLRTRGADYTFVLVGRSRSVLPYVDELTRLHGSRLQLHLDDESSGLDVPALIDDLAAGHGRVELYLCGPIRLMDAVHDAWRAARLPPADLRFETFGNSGSWSAQSFLVRIPRLDRIVTVAADTSPLDSLERAGVAVMSDCRKGECGLCAVTVLDVDGRLDHRDVFLDADQKAAGDLLCLCVSRVAMPEGDGSPDVGSVVIDLP